MAIVGVVGDFRPDNETHMATIEALHHGASTVDVAIDVRWISTNTIDPFDVCSGLLRDCDGVVIAPGSPYESMDGALAAIKWARTTGTSLLATCGGFQHVVIEYARNVLGVVDAAHAEYDPYASNLFVTPFSCSLAGQALRVSLVEGTVAASAYGSSEVTERYYCDFGLNPDRVEAFTEGDMIVSGVDRDGEPRIVELANHPFFVATLFVPQTSSRPERPHPLVTTFLRCLGR